MTPEDEKIALAKFYKVLKDDAYARGYSSSYSINIDGLYDQCLQNHKNLIEKLGGHYKVLEITVPNLRRPLDASITGQYYNKLVKLVPDYVNSFGITAKHLQFPILDLGIKKRLVLNNIKRINSTKGDGSKFTTHFHHYVKKNKVRPSVMSEVAKILSVLGAQWDECLLKKNIIYAKISVSPFDFLKLGHTACDPQSCFKMGGANEVNKYYLSAQNDTFICQMSFDKNALEDIRNLNRESIIARSWGFFRDNIVNFCNYYKVQDSFDDATYDYCIRSISEFLLDTPIVSLDKSNETFKIHNVYQNKSHNISFFNKDKIKIEQRKYEMTIPRSFNFYRCNGCGLSHNNFDDSWTAKQYCNACETTRSTKK